MPKHLFKPGNKYGKGKPKGALSKRTLLLQEVFKDMGLDVPKRLHACIAEMQKLYDEAKKVETKAMILSNMTNTYLEVMQYLYPKRRAIEIENTQVFEQSMTFNLRWQDEDDSTRTLIAPPNSSPKEIT